MSDFFINLIMNSAVEEPRTNSKFQFTDVYDSVILEQINNVQGTGVYQIFGFRSTNSTELEELLYVGKTKKRDVGVRVHEQLTNPSKTFRKNVSKAGYKTFCQERTTYDKVKDTYKAVFVSRIEILVFPHSAKGEAGRDITEILLIHSGEKPSIFNDEFTDSKPVERLREEENMDLFKHQQYDGVLQEEIKEENMSVGTLDELFPDS